MGRIYGGIEELVGRTPLVRLARLEGREGVRAEILAKMECFNPAGSARTVWPGRCLRTRRNREF